ncbi:MAG: hypothetical protein MJH13_22195, partial [Shewanella sp.]|nr:hypothetical protein [Shewanella sp.]
NTGSNKNSNTGSNLSSNISHEADGIITIDEIDEKFIELYWQHSLPFSATDAEPFLLLQNSGKQSALINNLSAFRSQGVRNLSQLKAHSGWSKLCSETRKTL